MAKRARGYLSKATRKLKKRKKLTVVDFMREFSVGERVIIKPKPFYKSAIPHMRYRGKPGVVIEQRGSCYLVEVRDGGKTRKIISHPIHLADLPTANKE